MSELKALSVDLLYRPCDPAELGFETTAELPDLRQIIGQARALDALQFGVGIRRHGYNLFVLGPPGLGKHTVVAKYLEDKAAAGPVPFDWCYVNDFETPNTPKVLELPPGDGARLRRDMERLIDDLLSAIPAGFNTEEYQARAKEIEKEFHERQEQAFSNLQENAQQEGIALLRTPGGFAFAPKTAKDEVMSPEEFGKLSDDEQKRIETLVSGLQEQLQRILRLVPQWRKETRDKFKQLNRETTLLAVGHEIDDLRHSYAPLPDVQRYLDAVQQDILDNADDFRRQEESENPLAQASARDPTFRRYRVNVLVDQGGSETAPVIYEDNPTYANLIGRIEHLAQMGTLVTDFMLIKPGALHRANDLMAEYRGQL